MPIGKYVRTEEHKRNWRLVRIGHVVTKETREKIRDSLERTRSLNPPAYSHLHARKGKTYEEIYGIEKAKEIKDKSSKKNTGRKFGKMPLERIEKMKETKRKKMLSGWISPMRGKTYEEIYGVEKAIEQRKKLSLSHTGLKSNKKDKTFEQIYGIEKANELKKKNSLTLKNKYNTRELVCPVWMKEKGRIPWNKDKKGLYKQSEESNEKRRMKLLGRNKGKTLEERYGNERAKEIRFRCGNGSRGSIRGPHSIETRRKIATSNVESILKGKHIRSKWGKGGYYNSKNKGVVWFRSSWELKVMEYFDKNDIDWIYETSKNRFFLKSINKGYVNDFYLPNEDKYIQVKGYPDGLNKFYTFQMEYPDLKTELWDTKVLKEKEIL